MDIPYMHLHDCRENFPIFSQIFVDFSQQFRNPVLLQWVRDNYSSAEKIMAELDMLSDLGSIGMMRHKFEMFLNLLAFLQKIWQCFPGWCMNSCQKTACELR